MILDALACPNNSNFKDLACLLALKSFKLVDKMGAEYFGGNTFVASDEYSEISKNKSKRQFASRLWAPNLGHTMLGLIQTIEKDEVEWFRANLAITMFLAGIRDNINISISTKLPLAINGLWLKSAFFLIQGSQYGLVVKDKKDNILFEQRITSKPDLHPLLKEPSDNKKSINNSKFHYASNEWYDFWMRSEKVLPKTNNIQRYHGKIVAALQILKEYTPTYNSWIEIVVREISPQIKHGFGTSSASFPQCPGMVHLSEPPHIPAAISALVHESSHQYFHMLIWNSVIVKPGAPQAYSVLKDKKRPLQSLLLGHHALANVCLVLGRLIETDFKHPLLLSEYENNHSRLTDLTKSIKSYDSEFATGIGYSLYEALDAELKRNNYI
jgi:hypothetical protein